MFIDYSLAGLVTAGLLIYLTYALSRADVCKAQPSNWIAVWGAVSTPAARTT